MNHSRLALQMLLLVAVGALLLGPADAFAAPSGAIFTTNVNGTRVNQNKFDNKCDVYLDGGPGINAPQGAAALPDGDYYFQVTDPSGKTLLSTDTVASRQVNVTNGIFTGPSGAGNHATGNDTDHPPAKTIQLCDYLDTPNNGGVYKVWVTPIGDFVGDPSAVDFRCNQGCFHGFIPAHSKTDNFKVKGTTGPGGACLIVNKLLNGTPTAGWPITVTDPLGTVVQGGVFSTQNSKECILFNLTPGKYTVTEDLLGSTVAGDRVDGVFVTISDSVVLTIKNGDTGAHEIIFYNVK